MTHVDRLLLVDIEQACWDDGRPPGDIIEIGVVELKLRDTPSIGRQHRLLVRPARGCDISPFCTKLTGLTERELKLQGRPFGEVAAKLLNEFGTASPWAAWGRDDEDLARDAEKHMMPAPFGPRFTDLAALWSLLVGGGKRVGLQTALAQLGEPFVGTPHRALDDALNTATVFRRMAEMMRGVQALAPALDAA